MTAFYLDTSAFLKLVVREKHSVALHRWLPHSQSDLVASDPLRTEAIRAAWQHSVDAAIRARELLDIVLLIQVSREICDHAADLDSRILRSLDALHLATALEDGSDLRGIVTFDARLAEAASLHGIAAVSPGEPRNRS